MAGTVSMHKVRAVTLLSVKHAVETKWGRRDSAVRVLNSTTRVPLMSLSYKHSVDAEG